MTLPRLSLNAMRAFEATARLHSFSAAADELFVTHGAISRHIRILEDSLGLPLLVRSAHGTKPTAEGQRFAASLSRAFALIQSSIEQLMPGPLTLSCSESIMMYWLIPRLAQFQKTNHGIELRFNMSSGSEGFTRDNSSVALRLSSIDPPKQVISKDVVTEWIGPVCSAQYLRSLRLESAADLARARLMVSRTRPHAWTDWTRCGTQDIGDLHVDETFDHLFLLIQAARCGLGFINVPRMLVQEDLNSGALVAPLGFLAGPNKLSIWVASHLSRRPDTIKLVDWLTNELRAAEQPADG